MRTSRGRGAKTGEGMGGAGKDTRRDTWWKVCIIMTYKRMRLLIGS